MSGNRLPALSRTMIYIGVAELVGLAPLAETRGLRESTVDDGRIAVDPNHNLYCPEGIDLRLSVRNGLQHFALPRNLAVDPHEHEIVGENAVERRYVALNDRSVPRSLHREKIGTVVGAGSGSHQKDGEDDT